MIPLLSVTVTLRYRHSPLPLFPFSLCFYLCFHSHAWLLHVVQAKHSLNASRRIFYYKQPCKPVKNGAGSGSNSQNLFHSEDGHGSFCIFLIFSLYPQGTFTLSNYQKGKKIVVVVSIPREKKYRKKSPNGKYFELEAKNRIVIFDILFEKKYNCIWPSIAIFSNLTAFSIKWTSEFLCNFKNMLRRVSFHGIASPQQY